MFLGSQRPIYRCSDFQIVISLSLSLSFSGIIYCIHFFFFLTPLLFQLEMFAITSLSEWKANKSAAIVLVKVCVFIGKNSLVLPVKTRPAWFFLFFFASLKRLTWILLEKWFVHLVWLLFGVVRSVQPFRVGSAVSFPIGLSSSLDYLTFSLLLNRRPTNALTLASPIFCYTAVAPSSFCGGDIIHSILSSSLAAVRINRWREKRKMWTRTYILSGLLCICCIQILKFFWWWATYRSL